MEKSVKLQHFELKLDRTSSRRHQLVLAYLYLLSTSARDRKSGHLLPTHPYSFSLVKIANIAMHVVIDLTYYNRRSI